MNVRNIFERVPDKEKGVTFGYSLYYSRTVPSLNGKTFVVDEIDQGGTVF